MAAGDNNEHRHVALCFSWTCLYPPLSPGHFPAATQQPSQPTKPCGCYAVQYYYCMYLFLPLIFFFFWIATSVKQPPQGWACFGEPPNQAETEHRRDPTP